MPGPKALPIGPLTVSEKAVAMMVRHEAVRTRPYHPGGDSSGVTLGIGYDLGHHAPAEIGADWGPHIGTNAAQELTRASGKYGRRAKALLPTLRHVWAGPEACEAVFREKSLPKYARQTVQAFPGVENLPPDAQGALLSLVYNRGPGMKGDRRREMREIREHLADPYGPDQLTLTAIAAQIRSMKRLWVGKGLDGLLRRRDEEAELVEHAAPLPKPDPHAEPVDVLPPPSPKEFPSASSDCLARFVDGEPVSQHDFEKPSPSGLPAPSWRKEWLNRLARVSDWFEAKS